MKRKILITADIHFERIPKEKRDNFINYVKESIVETLPDFFIIAGDTSDSRNLRAESEDFHEICKFVEDIKDVCKKQGTTFIILRGTPSHDGDIMQNICSFIGNDILYIDEMCSKNIKDINIGFIPEMYYSKYDDFLSDLNTKIKFNQDIIIYHGMMGFAIPAVKQHDSQWNLHRNLVMRHTDVENYANCLVIGGHVHEFMNKSKTYYTGRAISNPGEVTFNRVFGLQLVDIDTTLGEYTLKTLVNKDVDIVRKVEIDITKDDIDFATHFGYKIKLLAAAGMVGNTVECNVQPALVSENHPLASVNNEFNAIFLKGNAVDDLMFYGKGAGPLPTGSAVMGDIIEIAKAIDKDAAFDLQPLLKYDSKLKFTGEGVNQYYIRMTAADMPGVLGNISSTFGKYNVGIESMIQNSAGISPNDTVPLIFIVYEINRTVLDKALNEILSNKYAVSVDSVMRVER